MSRKVENPDWRAEWYEKYQKQYAEWLRQAGLRGVRARGSQVINRLGDIEEYLSGELGVSLSSVRAWRREEGSGGATYPQEKAMLWEIWRLLQLPGTMETEDWVAVSALYRDFARLLQIGGRAFLWERCSAYREIPEVQSLFDYSGQSGCMSLEKRCEFLGRLKGRYLTAAEVAVMLDFYTGTSCYGRVFERLCDGERLWKGIRPGLEAYRSARRDVLLWLDGVKAIDRLRVTSDRRLGAFYWRRMDECLKEWQKRVPDQRRVKDFNLLRLVLTGYVPISFEARFGRGKQDWEQTEREYTCLRPGAEEIFFAREGHSRSVSVKEFAYVHDWFFREQAAQGGPSADHRKEKKAAVSRELQAGLREARDLEGILESLEEDFGSEEECMAIYADGSALDRAACVMYESERYQRAHPGILRFGFADRGEAEVGRRRYEAAELSEEEKRRLGSLYFVQTALQGFVRFWTDRGNGTDVPFLSERLACRLGESMTERLIEYLAYLLFDERELAGNLRAIQTSMRLREELLPKLSGYMEGLPLKALEEAEADEASVLGIVLKLKELDKR